MILDGLVIDLILVLIFLVFMAIGYFQGFLRSVISLLGTVGSGIVAYLTRNFVAGVLNSWFGLGKIISDGISGQVAGISSEFSITQGATAEELVTIINNSDAGVIYKKLFSLMVDNFKITAPVTVCDVVGAVVSNIAVVLLAIVIMFVLLKVIVFVLDRLFKKIPRKSMVGTANGILGLFVGMTKGLLFVGAVLIVCYFLNMIPSVNEALYPIIEKTYVTKYLYNFVGGFLL